MKYGLPFLAFGIVMSFHGSRVGGWQWLLLWPGVDFMAVGAAYFAGSPWVLGKRLDGTRSWWAACLLAPFFLLAWLVWRITVTLSREDCCNELVPGVFVGRRPRGHELPDGITWVVDLTAEFAENPAVRRNRHYIALPTLDGSTPRQNDFDNAVGATAEWPGQVYVHCAQGHGRTAVFAVALLMRKGLAGTVDSAFASVKQVRPSVTLSHQQWAFLRRVCENSGATGIAGRDA